MLKGLSVSRFQTGHSSLNVSCPNVSRQITVSDELLGRCGEVFRPVSREMHMGSPVVCNSQGSSTRPIIGNPHASTIAG